MDGEQRMVFTFLMVGKNIKRMLFCDMKSVLNSDFSVLLKHIMPFVFIMSVVASTLQQLMEVVEIAALMPAK